MFLRKAAASRAEDCEEKEVVENEEEEEVEDEECVEEDWESPRRKDTSPRRKLASSMPSSTELAASDAGQSVDLFGEVLRASLANRRQNAAAAAAIASATTIAGAQPGPTSISPPWMELHNRWNTIGRQRAAQSTQPGTTAIQSEPMIAQPKPALGLWHLAFGRIRHRHHTLEAQTSLTPDGSLSATSSYELHELAKPKRERAQGEGSPLPSSGIQSYPSNTWRTNTPAQQHHARGGVKIGGRVDASPSPKLSRQGSPYDTFYEKEDKIDTTRDQGDKPATKPAQPGKGQRYHTIIDDHPEEIEAEVTTEFTQVRSQSARIATAVRKSKGDSHEGSLPQLETSLPRPRSAKLSYSSPTHRTLSLSQPTNNLDSTASSTIDEEELSLSPDSFLSTNSDTEHSTVSRHQSKFPYETYVTNPYDTDQHTPASFISESDDDVDEFGDVSQYGSRNYAAAFDNNSNNLYSSPTRPGRKSIYSVASPNEQTAEATSGDGSQGSENFHCTHRDFCQYCQEEMRGYPRNWNEEFQSLLELPANSEEERLKRYELINDLAEDFSVTAKMYGKIIIAEAFLPRKYQTIKPCVVGGIAGGPKYIYNGIFFKFAMDDLGIYGSDENAMKVAAHDLKGLMRYSDIAGISVPLIQLIDYRGFRLVALSILPIEQSTLAYGSSDGGIVVHTDNPQLNAYMEAAAQKLNLKGHLGGSENCTNRKMIYGPTDIEGHVGLDGRFYVIDFSRVLPPTTPSKLKRNGYLYELMRPEFVKKNPKPLSSDAFSPFGVDSSAEHNGEVKEATNRLLKEVIPRFASYLDLHYPNAEELSRHLSAIIHKEGINIRYLGRLRHYVKSAHLKQLFLHEMIARVVKVALNQSLRKRAKRLKFMSEVACKSIVIKYFNLVLGRPKQKADHFWKSSIKAEVMHKFGEQSLTPEERQDFYDLRQKTIMCHILLRIQDLCGIHLTVHSKELLESLMRMALNNKLLSSHKGTQTNMLVSSFKVVASDIEEMSVKIKKMATVALAEANALALKSQQEVGDEAERLFKRSCNVFKQVIESAPDNASILNNYADVIAQRAFQKEKEAPNVRRDLDDLNSYNEDDKNAQTSLLSLQDRVDRSMSSILVENLQEVAVDHRGQNNEACITLLDKAIAIYITTKHYTMLEKLRVMLEKRYHATLAYCSWTEKQRLYDIITKIWTNLMTYPCYRIAYCYYRWGKFILSHAARYDPNSKAKAAELYQVAGGKLRDALQLDPLLPWRLHELKQSRPQIDASTSDTVASAAKDTQSACDNNASTSSIASSITPSIFEWERSRSSPVLSKKRQRSPMPRTDTKRESMGKQLLKMDLLKQRKTGDSQKMKRLPTTADLDSLLSSSPFLLSILEEEKKRHQDNIRTQTSALLSGAQQSPVSGSLSDSAIPIASTSSKPSLVHHIPPIRTYRRMGVASPPLSSSCSLEEASQHPETKNLFSARDLILLSNTDIACIIQVLSSLAKGGDLNQERTRDAHSKKESKHRKQPRGGKELTESEEERKLSTKRWQINEVGDVILDFESMCSLYTEAAVRTLLKYYADSVVELVLPDNPHVSDLVMGDISRYCRRLRSFTLIKCSAITMLGSLPATLETLKVLERPMHEESLAAIVSSCKQLRSWQYVNINGPQPSRNAPTLLSDFFESGVSTSLKAVKFINFDASVAPALKHLRACSNLSLLDLGNNSSIDEETLIHILRGCGSSLRKLSLEGCDRITDTVLDAVAQVCPQLCELDLAGCHAIGDEGVSSIVQSCSNLRTLNLSGCIRIRSSIGLLDHCTQLTSLILSGCTNLHTIAMERLASARKFTALQDLDISGFSELSFASISAIALGHPHLRRLIMRSLSTTQGIMESEELSTASSLWSQPTVAPARSELESELIRQLSESCRQLEVFEFAWRRESDNALVSSCANCEVVLQYDALNQGPTDSKPPRSSAAIHLEKFVNANPKLRTIALDELPIDDRALSHIGRSLATQLESIELQRCTYISTLGLRQLIRSAQKLRRLIVRGCNDLSATTLWDADFECGDGTEIEVGIESLLSIMATHGCHSLEEVDLCGSGEVDHGAAIVNVVNQCYALRVLTLDVGCRFDCPPLSSAQTDISATPRSPVRVPSNPGFPPPASLATRKNSTAAITTLRQQMIDSLLATSPSLIRLDLHSSRSSPSQ